MFKTRTKTTTAIFATIILTAICMPFGSFWNTQAAGILTGRVFQDFNGNGIYNTTTTITNNGSGTTAVAIDRGVQGVTVTAYDSGGVQRGTANTIADGTYSLSATGGGPYRLEFTNLPAGAYPSARSTDSIDGGTATNAGSAVQFVPDGNRADINLAINYPEDYSQNTPEIAASLYMAGNQAVAPAANQPTLISFPYGAGSTDTAAGATATLFDAPTARPLSLTGSQVGTTQGLAYARRSRTIYAGAYFKRHAGFGPGGPNAVYVISRTGTGSVSSTFTVPGTATNSHDTTNYPRDNGNIGWDAVGKTSLGGMAISEDETRLYVMNLANRTLYALNSTTGVQLASQAAPTNLPLPSGTCAANDARPFAVTYYRGSLYVGLVCSAESSANVDTFTDSNSNGSHDGGEYHIETNGTAGRQTGESFYDNNGNTTYDAGEPYVDNDGNGFYNAGDARNLRAYVYQVDPVTLAFGASPVFQAPLNYRRGVATHSAGAFNIWRPWSATYRSQITGLRTVYSQPMLTDIAFDNGNLILGLRDRLGDQVGNGSLSNPSDAVNTNFYQPRTAGDVLRACGTLGSWTLEANGRCGGTGNAPQNVSEGPGGGEFYFGDAYDLADDFISPTVNIVGKGGNHDDTANGGVEQMPGAPDVVITNFDSIPNVTNMLHDGGVRWLNNTTGAFAKGYRLYDGDSNDNGSLGKAGGVGGSLLLMPDPAPIEIGNRVWADTNGNGVQDPGEGGIQSVSVRLYNSSNTLVGTAVTDAAGEYYFVGSTVADPNITDNIGQINGGIAYNSNYQVRFDVAANYTGGGALVNRLLTTVNQSTQLGFADGSDSDASFVINPVNSPAGRFPVIPITTGGPGTNNHTFDVGFTTSATYSIGNRVWFDTNNDGQINAGEAGISGVSVSVFTDVNGDGNPDSPLTPDATMNTDANGHYRFDGLVTGNYVLRVNPSNFANAATLGGYRNTTGNNGADLDSTSVAGQNGEDGIDPAGAANTIQANGVFSASVALGSPGEPTSEADVQGSGQGSVDAAANMTVDFGFYRACISGTVWADNGAGGFNNNGLINAGEPGVPNVRVRIYTSTNVEVLTGPDGILGTADDAVNGMWTNGAGNYNFCGLAPGQYRVVVTPAGGTTSTPTSMTPDDNIDSDDNGFNDNTGNYPGRVIAELVTLTPGNTGTLGNTTVTNATGTTSNPTVDFGFVAPPTSVSLKTFTASFGAGGVNVKWSTGGEADNLGFNVYRQAADGSRVLVNTSLVAGSALRSKTNLAATADDYRWKDQAGTPESVYFLEDVDLSGVVTLHGPITPSVAFGSDGDAGNSILLSEMSSGGTDVQKDTVSREPTIVLSRSANSEPGLKFTVDHDGWYIFTVKELSAAGFDVNTNREMWKLTANGVEVPMRVDTSQGSIEFIGRALNTSYTAKQAYYLSVGQTPGLRLARTVGGIVGENPTADGFMNTVTRKDRTIYAAAILNGDAENWFGPIVNASGETAQAINVTTPNSGAANAHLTVKLQGLSTNAHLVNVSFNGLDLGSASFAGHNSQSFDFEVPMQHVTEGVNLVKFRSAASGDVSLVDTVSLTYSRKYVAQDDKLRFTVPAGNAAKIDGFTSRGIHVFQMANGQPVAEVSTTIERQAGVYFFSLAPAAVDREFIAVTGNKMEQPADLQLYTPGNWRNTANRADLLIVTPAEFSQQAQTLADRRQAQGLRSMVVPIEEIYDEFGGGVYSADALKQFLSSTTEWRQKPRYVIFFGDSSYDMRNYLGQASRDKVPTKLFDTFDMETASDSWFADFNNDGVEDISLGRLPVATVAEAQAMVEKLARYDAQSPRATRNNTIVTDNAFESYSDFLQTSMPQGVDVTRIDRSVLGDSQMRQSILSNLAGGPMVVTYVGHGTTGVWTNGSVFGNGDAPALNNSELSLYMLMTCLNGYSHNVYNNSLAETLLRSPNGAVAVWASSGSTFADQQMPMATEATKLLLSGQGQVRLGDAVKAAKLKAAGQDVRRSWQLLGDPTVVIR